MRGDPHLVELVSLALVYMPYMYCAILLAPALVAAATATAVPVSLEPSVSLLYQFEGCWSAKMEIEKLVNLLAMIGPMMRMRKRKNMEK